MPYDALTIDTQTVYANGRHLDRGLVGQLVQFKDGLVQVILTEIVVRELHKMLAERAKAPLDALAKAIKDGTANGQVSDTQKASLQATLDVLASGKDHATQQLQDFVTATGAHIVPAEKAALKQVLSAYFSKTPPFSTQGKKDEFPDAISLLALEAWATETNKKVLAVSGDGDWKAFAAQSERIDCMDDLGAAMALLVQAAEASVAEARNVLACIASADPPELKETLDAELARAVEDENPYAEFDSSMPGEDEGVTLAMLDYTVHGLEDGTTDIEIVRIRADGFVMRVPVTVTARAFVDVHFSIRDSIDKDYVPMGSTSIERDIEFEAFALIACTRHEVQTDAGATEVEYEIESAELVGAPQSVDLGYIDYSLADEDDEFDPDELQAGE
ncbi:MAG: PIN domain-containing protein [Hyphomicrobium sp.]|uniref:PIN domain-containing protein n=1 Tax=Hyphomicrobium sp. TaxID=82 RepID=UPI003D0C81EF